MMIGSYYNMIKQVHPRDGFQTMDSFNDLMALAYITDRLDGNYCLFPHGSKAMDLEDTICEELEFCQLAYEDGYSVIINDGKVLGYEKIAPAV